MLGDGGRSLAKTMKSFRLDTDSINDAIESWPALLAALTVNAGLAYMGWFDAAWRGVLIIFGAVFFGYSLRGVLTHKLRSKYPKATCIWLISIGMTSVAIGVFARMLLPSLQGALTDYVWIVVSFTTILAFVVINRHDPDVLR
ncbi:MAG: hypothetical protein ACK5EO_00085 [Planctomycetota bacterium]